MRAINRIDDIADDPLFKVRARARGGIRFGAPRVDFTDKSFGDQVRQDSFDRRIRRGFPAKSVFDVAHREQLWKAVPQNAHHPHLKKSERRQTVRAETHETRHVLRTVALCRIGCQGCTDDDEFPSRRYHEEQHAVPLGRFRETMFAERALGGPPNAAPKIWSDRNVNRGARFQFRRGNRFAHTRFIDEATQIDSSYHLPEAPPPPERPPPPEKPPSPEKPPPRPPKMLTRRASASHGLRMATTASTRRKSPINTNWIGLSSTLFALRSSPVVAPFPGAASPVSLRIRSIPSVTARSGCPASNAGAIVSRMIRDASTSGTLDSRPYPTSMRSARSRDIMKRTKPSSRFLRPTFHCSKARTAQSSIGTPPVVGAM